MCVPMNVLPDHGEGKAIHFLHGWLLRQTEAEQETSEQRSHPFLFNIPYLLVITIKHLMLQLLFFHLR